MRPPEPDPLHLRVDVNVINGWPLIHYYYKPSTYRLYRAQRLYVQLLPKSMLLAILIGNGIRLLGTITLCPENGFFMSYFTRHKGCMSISEKSSGHKGCMSFSRKSSEHKGCISQGILSDISKIWEYIPYHEIFSPSGRERFLVSHRKLFTLNSVRKISYSCFSKMAAMSLVYSIFRPLNHIFQYINGIPML